MVEFDFDLAADTAYSVASEMVSDLSLSHEDAKVCLSSMSIKPSYLLRSACLPYIASFIPSPISHAPC